MHRYLLFMFIYSNLQDRNHCLFLSHASVKGIHLSIVLSVVRTKYAVYIININNMIQDHAFVVVQNSNMFIYM